MRRMPRSERLRKNREFAAVFERGRSFPGKKVVVYLLENSLPFNRVGVAVSRKLGGAVVRNRLKRVVKEAYRANEAGLRKGLDLVLVPRSRAKTASFQEVKAELFEVFSECGILARDATEHEKSAETGSVVEGGGGGCVKTGEKGDPCGDRVL